MVLITYSLRFSIVTHAKFLVLTFLAGIPPLLANQEDHLHDHDIEHDHGNGNLVPDDTTLFTIPTMTTTAVARDQDGFPVRSRYFSASEIKRKLMKFKIIPDVLDESQSPKNPCECDSPKLGSDDATELILQELGEKLLMYLKMEPQEKGTHALFGSKLETAIVRYEPFFIEWPTKFDELYTLIMISPDYPTRKNPSEKEYLHWMVINIPESYVTSGQSMADYVSTIPDPDKGYHRYVVLIFKQKQDLRVHRLPSRGPDPSRPHFSTRKFIQDYKLGAPYAINFFESKYTNDSEFWTTTEPAVTETTTDTPYPHAGFTWFPKTERPENESTTKDWFED